MQRSILGVAVVALAAMLATLALSAFGRSGLHWKVLTPTVAVHTPAKIRVELVDGAGDAVRVPIAVTSVRVDMSADNMAQMTAAARAVPAGATGVVVVETNLYAPGRWAVILAASANGQPVRDSITVTATPKNAKAPRAAERRILYYRNPMGLADTSPVPKKDPMGMDYVPVYADQATQIRGAVHLTAEKMQRTGVTTMPVMRMSLAKVVRASGTLAADETRQAVITARFGGFIEKLYVSRTGDVVRAGQPLMRVWIDSGDVLIREADYIGSLESGADAHAALAAGLLRQYGIPEFALKAMARSGTPTRTVTITAPRAGTVMEKDAVEGMHFSSGDTLFKTTDITHLWVLADVSERDLAAIRPGQEATIAFRDDPSASFDGKVLFVYPALDPATRTAKVRIAVANAGDRLRIGQYAEVRIAVPVSRAPVLAVPLSAVIDDGTRQVAFVSAGGGIFVPRRLELGARTADMVEVLNGLKQGERVVTSGNFLIDAESNLEAALNGFAPDPHR